MTSFGARDGRRHLFGASGKEAPYFFKKDLLEVTHVLFSRADKEESALSYNTPLWITSEIIKQEAKVSLATSLTLNQTHP